MRALSEMIARLTRVNADAESGHTPDVNELALVERQLRTLREDIQGGLHDEAGA